MRRRQLWGGLVVGVAIAALVAACGGTEGSEVNRGGLPTSVVGRADGQVTVAPTAVYVTVTRAATTTRTTTAATPAASPTR